MGVGDFELFGNEEFSELLDDLFDFIEDTTDDGLPGGKDGDGWCGDGRLEDERSGDGLDVKSNVGILNSEVLFDCFDFFSSLVLGIDGFGNFGEIEDGFGIVT